MQRSFYLLELWIGPGGGRKADYYLFNTVEEVKQTLKEDLEDPIGGAYLVLWYGETINLSVYSEGKVVWEKDLHPYITFYLPGYPPLRGTADGVILSLDQLSGIEGDRGKQPEISRDELSELLWSESEQLSEYRVEIDWEAIEIPELEGQRLQPGEVVTCKESYTNGEEQFEYGYNSLE